MKNKNGFFSFLMITTLFLTFSCSNTGNKQPVDESLSISGNDVITDMLVEEGPLDLTKGEEIYKTKCMVCHQATGLGIPGSFPPLAGSDYLLADKKRAFMQVQNGSKEPLTINGVEYPGGVMPPQELTEEETIEVLNYVYNSWGNSGGRVSLNDIK